MGFLLFSTLYQNFTGISPEFRQNIDSEHLQKRDNRNSAFPPRTPSICGLAAPSSERPPDDRADHELRYSYPYPCHKKSSTNFLPHPFTLRNVPQNVLGMGMSVAAKITLLRAGGSAAARRPRRPGPRRGVGKQMYPLLFGVFGP